MDVLLDYSLEDFLLFSPDVYWRLFELHNVRFAAAVPFCVAATALMLTAPFLGHRGRRAAFAAAAGASALTAWAYFLGSYPTINWAAPWLAAPFLGLSVVLAILGLRSVEAPIGGARRILAIALLIHGGLIYPFQGVVSGRPMEGAQILGLAPDPTAIACLGLLLLARQGPLPGIGAGLALIWCLFGGLTLTAMGSAEAWALFGSAAVAVTAFLVPRRSSRS